MEKETYIKMNSKNLLITLTLIVLSFLSWHLRLVILIFFSAIVIAVALDVLINIAQKHLKLQRSFALIIVLLLLLISGIFIFQLLVPELINQIKELGILLPTFIAKVKAILASQPRLLEIQESLPDQIDWRRIEPFGIKLLGFAGGAANTIFQILLVSLLAILFTFDPASHQKIIISLTPKPYRKDVSNLLLDFRRALGGWLTGMTISASSMFVLTWAGLTLLQVPLALLSALICGVLTFIPTIGPSIATLLPLGISLIISPRLMIEVLILRIILQNLEAFVLTPLLLNRTVNLLPTVALMSQVVLGTLLGLPGVLIALPLAVVIQVGFHKIIIKKVMDKWV